MPSIRQWLVGLGLERYGELFALHSIDFDVLAELSDADLEKLQIPLGDRKRLLRAIAGLAAPADVAAALERRPVTVLFVDITDYTGLTGQLGAEFTHKLARRFHQLASQSIREYGGSVEKYVGDAVMGVFGIPSAHGDDPERALRTAAAIHAQMPQLSDEFGRPLTVHIGAATGQVVASRQDARTGNFSSVGDTINLAARLVGLAAAGDTVISDTLFQAAQRFMSAESVGDVQVKGFQKAVRVWRVTGLADRAVRTVRPRELPLVGRQAELRQFDAVCRACLAARTGQLVYLRGEAGIGKSRLVEALEAAAASLGFQVHRALVLNFGVARANDAISQLVASLLGCEPGADAQQRADALRRAAQSKRVDEDHLVFARDGVVRSLV